MTKGDNLRRLLMLLLLTLVMSLALYALPEELFGFRIKKVDMLSDIRIKPKAASLDSLKLLLAHPDTMQIDTMAIRESVMQSTGIDSATLNKRDSLYRQLYAAEDSVSKGKQIEDFSPGHIALKRFFKAINDRNTLERPVRIAFLGDSFVEGDIMVADLRSLLQKEYGGRGVGFIPVTSVTSQYQPTIEHTAEGWESYSLIHDEEVRYALPGVLFEANEEQASLQLKNTKRYPELSPVSSVKFIYESNTNTNMRLVLNEGADTIKRRLPPTTVITQNIQEGEFTQAEYLFEQAKGFKALGVALEDNKGIIVDNFSLRGNSGLVLERLDSIKSKEFAAIRPYDLIVLQYGLNIVSEGMLDYGWYGQRMLGVIKHLQGCFPESDILLLSVSDRSHQEGGRFETMPEVLAMLHTQRQLARRAGVAFWNLFEGMGGEDSMVDFVEKGWAGKDYTHLSFRGGREIAKVLVEALLMEKKFYDDAEETLH